MKYRMGGGEGKFRKEETVVIRSDEGLTLETSALKLLTYLIRYQLYSEQILYPRSHIYHFPVPNFTIEILFPF